MTLVPQGTMALMVAAPQALSKLSELEKFLS
jgi:hypothetical protein